MLHLTVGILVEASARFCVWRNCNIHPLTIKLFSVVHLSRARRSDRHLPGRSDDIALRVELFDEEVERLSLFDVQPERVRVLVPLYYIPKTH